MRLSVVATAICLSIIGVSAASDAAAVMRRPTHIPAQALSPALELLAKERDIQLVYRSELVGNRQTAGAAGDLTFEEALTQLLSGTGLTYRYLADNAVTIIPLSSNSTALRSSSGEAERFHLAQADTQSKPESSAADTASSENAPSQQSSEGLDEVVVTATKRSEPLQRVPQAITAITSERLDQLNARSFDDYFRDVPGLMLVTTEPTKRDFSLRGIGSGNITANANTVDISTVAQYFDDISVTSGGFQVDPHLVDIERVEVLRGPQGTLYGEGALGGMIRIVTRKPDLNNFAASVEGRVSNTQDGGVSNDESATINLPFVKGVAALRLNGFYSEDAGYLDMVYHDSDTGEILGTYKKDYDSSRSSGVRGQLLLKPNDSFSALGQVIHSKSHNNFGVYFPGVGDLLDRVDTCHVNPPPPPPPTDPNAPPPPPPDVSQLPLSDTCVGGSYPSRDETANLYNLTLQADFGWASLVSSSSYAKVEGDTKITEINTIAGPLRTYSFQIQDQKAFIQELRLVSSKAWSERWDYVVGAFYQDKDASYIYPPLFGGGPEATFTNHPKATEKALFADTGYMLTSHLQARLGLRVSRITNEGTINIDDPNQDIQPQHPSSNFNPAPITGRAVLTYFINPDMMTYASAARGFRNGTLNNILVNYGPASQEPGFVPVPATSNPDTVMTYEMGWKLSFPSYRATLNGAVFHTDWRNMQVQSFRYLYPGQPLDTSHGIPQDQFRPVFVNAARSRVDGLELEASMELLRGLQGKMSFSYLDAVLTQDFPLYDVAGNPVLHGLKGDRIPFVAKTSGSVSLSYRHPLVSTFNGFVDLNGQYQGSRATDFNPILDTAPEQGGTSPIPFSTYYLLKPYWTTSMQLGVQNAQWRASLYLDNLFNNRADLFHSGDARVTTRPRTVGLFVRRNFD